MLTFSSIVYFWTANGKCLWSSIFALYLAYLTRTVTLGRSIQTGRRIKLFTHHHMNRK